MSMKKFFLIFLITIFCVSFFTLGYNKISLGIQSQKWPSVKGQVQKSEIEKSVSSSHSHSGGGKRRSSTGSSTCFSLLVEYLYDVNGQKYTSNTITYKGMDGSEKGALKLKQKYPAGSDVFVYYNPNKPKQSVLEPGSDYVGYLLMIFSLVLGLVAFFSLRKFDFNKKVPNQ